MKKIVWTLYRVSTERQTSDDDIPVQRNACREFIDKKSDWQLQRELLELGVSGFKKSAKDRNAIETLRKAALDKEFDVLLVFMYDRLGRKHEETPFVVEWFVKRGVEVWSVVEGQRKFENHLDSLMNYITFWQASGESIKTSQRVTEALIQKNEKGEYTGGTAPYGYEIYQTNEKHPKYNKFISKLKINESEREILEIMFELIRDKAYGAVRIAKHLTDLGYKKRDGSIWSASSINKIVRNPILKGYQRYNYINVDRHIVWDQVKLQPFNPDYQIIEEQTFDDAQKIMDARKLGCKENTIPTRSKLLLAGIAKCGYCGGNLTSDYSVKTYKRKKDGRVTKTISTRYVCKFGKNLGERGKHESIQFGSKKYEKEVIEIIKNYISQLDKEKFIAEISKHTIETDRKYQLRLIHLKKALQLDYSKLSKIKNLLIKVELGQSKLSSTTIEDMFIEQEQEINKKNKNIRELEYKLNQKKLERFDDNQIWENWIKNFDSVEIDTQKVMFSRIINKLTFRKNMINIEFAIYLFL